MIERDQESLFLISYIYKMTCNKFRNKSLYLYAHAYVPIHIYFFTHLISKINFLNNSKLKISRKILRFNYRVNSILF